MKMNRESLFGRYMSLLLFRRKAITLLLVVGLICQVSYCTSVAIDKIALIQKTDIIVSNRTASQGLQYLASTMMLSATHSKLAGR